MPISSPFLAKFFRRPVAARWGWTPRTTATTRHQHRRLDGPLGEVDHDGHVLGRQGYRGGVGDRRHRGRPAPVLLQGWEGDLRAGGWVQHDGPVLRDLPGPDVAALSEIAEISIEPLHSGNASLQGLGLPKLLQSEAIHRRAELLRVGFRGKIGEGVPHVDLPLQIHRQVEQVHRPRQPLPGPVPEHQALRAGEGDVLHHHRGVPRLRALQERHQRRGKVLGSGFVLLARGEAESGGGPAGGGGAGGVLGCRRLEVARGGRGGLLTPDAVGAGVAAPAALRLLLEAQEGVTNLHAGLKFSF
mmetsp:Transcript_30625/g.64984  ORF Transcript_30625/g.64984 Transcript_30625/m.64984 type:complete len:301 (+) Transcript_30625:236-1138(+)